LTSGGISNDNVIFVLQMALLNWMVTYLAVWFVFRAEPARCRRRVYRVWLAIIPCGILLLMNLAYAPKDLTVYFILYIMLALLLVIRFNLFAQEQVWRWERVHFNAGEVIPDFLRAGALSGALILALAWLVPPVVLAHRSAIYEAVRGPWYDLQVEWNRLFASLNYRPAASADMSGKSLALGGPRQPADRPVLEVVAPPSLRYWRMVVFDRYTGSEWQNTDDTVVRFGADYPPLPLIGYQARQVMTHTVTVLSPGNWVLALAGQPAWTSLSARATLSYVTPTQGAAAQAGATLRQVDTISFVRSRFPTGVGDPYTVTDMISQASVPQLRTAGNSYPAWIAPRYVELPDRLPERVKLLAQTVALPYSTAYDKASAIETYLRRSITYDDQIAAPPAGRDPVDYVLFDSRQGYCDYYASAMAIMLRTLGIPARLASGYAQGTYSSAKQAYVVSQKDAHTWVEVFFPRYGWIEFEPTAGQPAIVRPAGSQDGPPGEPAPDPQIDPREAEAGRLPQLDSPADPLPGSTSQNILAWAELMAGKPVVWLEAALLLVVVAAGLGWFIYRRKHVTLSQVELTYLDMLRLAGRAGVRLYAWQTPYEHAMAVGGLVPDGQVLAWRIAGLYIRERYGRQPVSDAEQIELGDAWRALRLWLLGAILKRRLRRLLPGSSARPGISQIPR
jgi:transglutaminase-like putative cysteine protease